MATDIPRFSISMDEQTFGKVLTYKAEQGIATQSKAIIKIMEMGLKELEKGSINKQSPLYSSEACKLAEDFDKKLDSWGRKTVRAVTDSEISRCQAEAARPTLEPEGGKILRFRVPEYVRSMSAGTGQEAGREFPQDLELTKAPPRGTSYVARVSGDSMEPTYHSGDLVFVHSCEEIPAGHVGVFLMDGQQWVKERGDGVLLSHNPAYPPRPMTEGTRCQGLVLGVCDQSYFE